MLLEIKTKSELLNIAFGLELAYKRYSDQLASIHLLMDNQESMRKYYMEKQQEVLKQIERTNQFIHSNINTKAHV